MHFRFWLINKSLQRENSVLPTLFAVVLACLVSTCTTVSEEDKRQALDRLLKVEEDTAALPAESPSVEENPTPEDVALAMTTATAAPTATATAAPTATATAASTATATIVPTPQPEPTLTPLPRQKSTPAGVDAKAPVGLAKKPALNVVQPVQLNLPLPRGVEHSDFLQFETAHSEIMAAYQPLSKEWLLFAKSFSKGRRASEEEVAALRIRVRENLAGTHWLFVWGVQQTSIMLLGNNPQKSFLIDRQQDFLERMNLLLFITGELQAAKMRADYRGFLRDFYKHANAKFFKRPLRDRSPRPESLIRPDSNPNSSE